MEQFKKILAPYLKQNDFELYDISFVREYGHKILQVLIEKNDGDITVLELENINRFLSEKLDSLELIDDEYMLEVSSPGAEKELKTKEMIVKHINDYICIKTKDNEIYGYLLEVNDNDYLIKVNEKGRIRKIKIEKEKIEILRLAVKL